MKIELKIVLLAITVGFSFVTGGHIATWVIPKKPDTSIICIEGSDEQTTNCEKYDAGART